MREPLSAALASPPHGTVESKPGEQRGGMEEGWRRDGEGIEEG